jgi:succinate dehydrogenase cytochrome b subunit
VTTQRLSPGDPAGRWSTRRHRLSGFVVLVWALWIVVQLVVLRVDPLRFDQLHDWSGALGARLAACAVLAALLYHALDGLRIVVLESVRVPGPRLRGLVDATVLFLWLALGVPAATVVLWPAIEGRLP